MVKTILQNFEDSEFQKLKKAKSKTGLTWHDWILTLAEDSKG